MKNDYSDDEMEDELDESIDDEDSNEEALDKKAKIKVEKDSRCQITKSNQYPNYTAQNFGSVQYPQSAYNQYSPVNSYQNFYQPAYYQSSFQNDYQNFSVPQSNDFNQLPIQQIFQFSNLNNDYMINRASSSVASSSSQQQASSSNSIIQVLSQFQPI